MNQQFSYWLLAVIACLFVFFLLKKYWQLKKKRQETVIGYCLLVRVYKKEDGKGNSLYFGVFQQTNQEWDLALSFQQYAQMKPPQRGYLICKETKVQSFSESEG
jgi:hypothetical protein